jgi:1-acyl-sn-glycerol-3-phosphate acyltransferase
MRLSVQAYIECQPRLVWRREALRRLIRIVGFRGIWRVEVHGVEHIPASGSTVLMMNHISGIDPIVCMGAVTARYVIPMTKIENAQHPILGWFVRWYGAYTVNRGEVDRVALTNSIELLKSGQLILIAPEGTRSRSGLQQPKDGLAYVATKADAVIVPAAVSGAVGWEDSLKRFKRHAVRVDFGKPFKFRTLGRARIPRDELAQMTQEAMYQLAAALPDPNLRGVYHDLRLMTTETLEFLG